jgi:hypothetical protein
MIMAVMSPRDASLDGYRALHALPRSYSKTHVGSDFHHEAHEEHEEFDGAGFNPACMSFVSSW